ncbi:hypothetical protein H6P81_019671 [Aristolochia fimbriata]|uniref:UBX domain-containing protein n=1 Tax=Aristolochia fimbriata TaxID=158543 RepID=A0AAV7DTK3_ARIFI|nr:hypothetical protein H6P81_019671 [Aristolochia fimbriata]
MERNDMMEQFLSVFPEESAETATQYLEASAWDLLAAVQLVLDANSGGDGLEDPPLLHYDDDDRCEISDAEDEEATLRGRGGASDWDPNGASGERLASLYRSTSSGADNRKEFDSHLLNRDTWANEIVAQTIPSHFVFWQEYEDSMEGKKVCAFYKIDSIPAVLVIDSITGQKMKCWKGMVEPQRLLADLMPFLEKNPFEYFRKGGESASQETTASQKVKIDQDDGEELLESLALEDDKEDEELVIRKGVSVTYPILPEEPAEIRLPDGRKLERNFLQTDPVQLLWSFCESQLEEKLGSSFPSQVGYPWMRNHQDPARGYVPLLVGSEHRNEKFFTHFRLLRHPFILSLLEIAAQEYGYSQHGILKIPCDVEHFRKVVDSISK